MTPPDPDRLRLLASLTAPVGPSVRPPRHRPRERFLKGPIPWAWLDQAGRLPGKALAVGLVIWQKAGAAKKRTVRLCQAQLGDFGLNEDSTRRGIVRLERAGLVTVRRRPGRGLEVTLLEVRDGAGDEAEDARRSWPG